MKALIFLLSFMFVSCVTANTESRDLSAVNEKPDQEQTLIEDKTRPLMLADDYDDCMIDCIDNGGSERGCHCVCGWETGGCYKYSQSPKENKKPLMLADHIDCDDFGCVKGCICEGGSSSQCHRVCEE